MEDPSIRDAAVKIDVQGTIGKIAVRSSVQETRIPKPPSVLTKPFPCLRLPYESLSRVKIKVDTLSEERKML